VRAVFFDAVGTVILPAVPATQVYATAAERHGLTTDPATLGSRLWGQFRAEEAHDRELNWVTSEARERERWRNIVFAAIDGATDDLFEELYQHFARPAAWIVTPTAAECIARLHANGVPVGMGSNYDSRLASVVNGTSALRPLGERLVISSQVGVRKPGRGFFEHVIQTAGCAPSDILFVGDDLQNDFDGATAAGLRAVLLDEHGKHPHVNPRVRSLSEVVL
jgi:putative hydrolase of the HAD superfamily